MYLTVPTAVSTASVFSIGLECATGTCSHSHSHSRSRAQRYPNISLLPRRADVLWASPLVASPPLPPPLSLSPCPLPPLPAPCPGTGHCQCYVTRRDAASSSFYLSGVPKSAVFFFFFFFSFPSPVKPHRFNANRNIGNALPATSAGNQQRIIMIIIIIMRIV